MSASLRPGGADHLREDIVGRSDGEPHTKPGENSASVLAAASTVAQIDIAAERGDRRGVQRELSLLVVFAMDTQHLVIDINVGRIAGEDARRSLARRLDTLLDQVRRAVNDWQPMLERLGAAIDAYRADPPPEADEAIAFL